MSGQVIGGDAVPPGGMEGGDWRIELQQEYRQLIVNKIVEQLKRHLPSSEGLQELKKIVVRYEEKIYSAATSQSEYKRRICLKMLSMETKYQNPMANSLQSNAAATNQNPQDPGTPPHISFSEEDLEEIKVVDRSDRTYNTIQYNRVLKEKMKFKKWDPKLKALASAKKAKSPPPPLEAPSQKKQKGIVISEDPKRRKLTSPHVSSLEVRAPQDPSSLPLEPHPKKQEHEVDPGSAVGMEKRSEAGGNVVKGALEDNPVGADEEPPFVEGDQLVDPSNEAPVI